MVQVVALLSMFGVGVTFSLIGSLKLALSERLGIDDGRVGLMISMLMITCSITVIPIGIVTDIIGFKPVVLTGFIVAFIAILMLVMVNRYQHALLACIVLGIASMCLNMGNILVPLVVFGGNSKTAAANLGNVFFGGGAFIAPLLVGLLIRKLGFKITGIMLASLLLVPAAITVITDFPAINSTYLADGALGLLINPVIMVAAVAMFCYLGLEISMGGWITTYATDQGFGAPSANMLLSLFWISIIVSRLIAVSIISADIGVDVVIGLSLLSIVTLTGMKYAGSKMTAGLCIILTGLVFGPIFPTMLGGVLEKTDESLYGSAFGFMYAIGQFGGSSIPAAVGMWARKSGIKRSLLIVVGTAVALSVTVIILGFV